MSENNQSTMRVPVMVKERHSIVTHPDKEVTIT